ncbi:hypothetical protein EBR21_13225 [bacterium]|nr:hypothetical protein [bacterium]
MKFDSGGKYFYFAILIPVSFLLFFALDSFRRPVILMSPAADNKVEQAYRRSGFGDRIMSTERKKSLSNCYKNMLRSNGYDEARPTPKAGDTGELLPAFEGKVTFVFNVGEDGKMIDHDLVDSDFHDREFLNCIEKSLEGVRFLPPPLGINRYLAHEFVFKSDETFRREMEERKNQSPLTLVTATPTSPANVPVDSGLSKK